VAAAVTIRDVAKHAGVGVGTVSRVLNDSASVRESTRLRVLSSIEELNFSPSSAARQLSSGRSMALGIAVPFFTNDSVVRRVQGVVSILSESAYDLVLFDVENNAGREDVLSSIAQRTMVDGLLIISMLPHESDMERFVDAGIPAVFVDAHHGDLPSIIVDNKRGGRQAAQHLIDLGHYRIAYLSDYPDNTFNSSPVHDRYAGFRGALADAGLPFPVNYYVECAVDREDARRKAQRLLSLDEPPTAVFAYCDIQAIGVLEAARNLGLQVPGDLSVIGYDGIQAAEFVQLTTVRQSLYDSGVLGAQLLLQIIAGNRPEQMKIVLPTELVIRATTAPPA
jgi:DNA-binding LacI/PurR family transcriptional regulator